MISAFCNSDVWWWALQMSCISYFQSPQMSPPLIPLGQDHFVQMGVVSEMCIDMALSILLGLQLLCAALHCQSLVLHPVLLQTLNPVLQDLHYWAVNWQFCLFHKQFLAYLPKAVIQEAPAGMLSSQVLQLVLRGVLSSKIRQVHRQALSQIIGRVQNQCLEWILHLLSLLFSNKFISTIWSWCSINLTRESGLWRWKPCRGEHSFGASRKATREPCFECSKEPSSKRWPQWGRETAKLSS